MNPTRARTVLAEVERRRLRSAAMLGCCDPEQRAAIVDASRMKAFFCTRRAGKSYAIGIYLFLTALAFPGSSCLYLGLTKLSATGIMNKDILRVINERFGIGAVWKEGLSRWELPNGSHIYIRGADANSYEIGKVVGQKYRLAVLDEASKYRYDLHAIVYGALVPAMGDDLGTIILSGTPSNVTLGLFYEVTTGAHRGWSVHRWTWQQNTHARENIQRSHDQLVADNPMYPTTPLYHQEWLGEWVVDTDALVYKFRDDLNTIGALPKPAHEYTYGLGLDLGWTDPTAIVVGAYHPNDPCLYLVHAYCAPGLDLTDVAGIVKTLWACPSMGCHGPFKLSFMVGDAAALQGVEELRQRHGLPIESAAKPGKRGVIEAMNSELRTGRVKLLPDAASIANEWNALVWDARKLADVPRRWEEHPGFPNHLADAALYLWRKSRGYDAVPAKPVEPKQLTPEWERLRHERALAHDRLMRQNDGLMVDEAPPWLQEAG